MRPAVAQLGLGRGMGRDVSRHLLTDRDLHYDSENLLSDVSGKLRKRGGTRQAVQVNRSTYPQKIACYTAGSVDAARALLGVGGARYDLNGSFVLADPSGGALGEGDLVTSTGDWSFSQPFNHLGTIVFPFTAGNRSGLAISGGGLAFNTFGSLATPATAVVTAGDARIPLAAADAAAVQPGHLIVVSNASSRFIGRVAQSFPTSAVVTPRPAVGVAAPTSAATSVYTLLETSSVVGDFTGARVGCSFQTRPVYGAPTVMAGATNYAEIPGRICWGILPTETFVVGAITYGGLVHIYPGHVLTNNFIDTDLPAVRSIVPVGTSTLLVLGDTKTLAITGTLATLNDSNQSLPVELTPISTTVGCFSEASVQATPLGVVWASADGVYIYDGAAIKSAMAGTLASYWSNLVDEGLVVYGSAVMYGSTYVISTSVGAFLWDMHQAAGGWSRVDIPAFSGSAVDAYDNNTYACRYVDPTTTTAPTTRDAIFRLDSIINPAIDNPTDHDGNAVEATLVTGTFAAGDPTRLKRFRRVVASVDLKQPSDYDGTIGLVNAKVDTTLWVPNGGGEHGTTNWWRATGGTLSTISATTARAREGVYSIRFVTGAVNGGIRRDVPTGASNGATVYSVEAWIWNSTAGTVTLDVGGGTASSAVTGQWVQLLAQIVPAAGFVNLTLTISHSATAATVDVDSVRISILQPWQQTGTNLTAGGLIYADTQNAYEGAQGIKVITAGLGQGANYNTPIFNFRSLESYTARLRIKSISGITQFHLTFGDTLSSTIAVVAATASWVDYTSTWQPVNDSAGAAVSIRAATGSGVATFAVDSLRITGPAPQCSVDVIPGLEAEGDPPQTDWGNVAEFDPSTSGPEGAAGIPRHLVSRGMTLRYSQTGVASECEIVGAHVHYDLLRPERVQ